MELFVIGGRERESAFAEKRTQMAAVGSMICAATAAAAKSC
jgi:hypothetical protein